MMTRNGGHGGEWHTVGTKSRRNDGGGKREQLLVKLMAVPGELLSKRVRTKKIEADLMQPTPIIRMKIMECRVTM
jgi:hypothetical protein